jgi:hypothetical protein
MRCFVRSAGVIAGVLLFAAPSARAQGSIAFHVFGLSYHYQSRTYTDGTGVVRRYDQFNPGFGAEYTVNESSRLLVSGEAGEYRDSKGRRNVFAGPALRVDVGGHLLIGAAVVAMSSKTYGVPVAPLPLVTTRWSRAGLTATWIPALSRQESGAVGLFSTIYLWRVRKHHDPAS